MDLPRAAEPQLARLNHALTVAVRDDERRAFVVGGAAQARAPARSFPETGHAENCRAAHLGGVERMFVRQKFVNDLRYRGTFGDARGPCCSNCS